MKYIIEANSETQSLLYPVLSEKHKWEGFTSGSLPNLGVDSTDEYPTCISLLSGKIGSHDVTFYHDTSLYVNHKLIDDFIKLRFEDFEKIGVDSFYRMIKK